MQQRRETDEAAYLSSSKELTGPESLSFAAGRAACQRVQGQIRAQTGLRPRLSELQSDAQELREADATRRGLGDRKRNGGERFPTGRRGQAEKEKYRDRQAGYRNHDRHGAQTHGHRVMVHAVLAQAAEAAG